MQYEKEHKPGKSEVKHSVSKLSFRIVKLEERIAPHHRLGHHPPGQNKTCYWIGWGGYQYPCQ